eukprot:Clim_evm11s43 gene=Clim_evmTU11s43
MKVTQRLATLSRQLRPTAIPAVASRFENLRDWPYKPNFLNYAGFNMHYVDSAPAGSERGIILCTHGEPTWSYLYRHMIRDLNKRNFRVVTPDFIGMGRSDKPTNDLNCTIDFHINSLIHLITELDLKEINFVCQDWGGIIGLSAVPFIWDRFKSLTIMNTSLMPNDVYHDKGDPEVMKGFLGWKQYAGAKGQNMPVGKVVNSGCATELTAEEIDAYDAPFVDASHKIQVDRFPKMVPISKDYPAAKFTTNAYEFFKTPEGQSLDVLIQFSDDDRILGAFQPLFVKLFPNATVRKVPGSHFLQEDSPELICQNMDEFLTSKGL